MNKIDIYSAHTRAMRGERESEGFLGLILHSEPI